MSHTTGKLQIWNHPQTGEVHLVNGKQQFVCTVGTLPNEREQEILADANRIMYAWNRLVDEEIASAKATHD